MLTPALQGFGLGLGLIVPIGAQNAYVITRGINRNHHFLSAAICTICDAILISVGVFGGGQLVSHYPVALRLITLAGIGFLLVYGTYSIISAVRVATTLGTVTSATQRAATVTAAQKRLGLVVLGTLLVTLLNPHVYLDTVVMLGSIGGSYQSDARLAFVAGTMLASCVWFFCLAAMAARMARLLSKPKYRAITDALIGAMMLLIASQLLLRL